MICGSDQTALPGQVASSQSLLPFQGMGQARSGHGLGSVRARVRPGQGSNQTALPGQGDNQTALPGQGSNQTALPGQGGNQTALPGQGSNQTALPGQGSNQTALPGQGGRQAVQLSQGNSQRARLSCERSDNDLLQVSDPDGLQPKGLWHITQSKPPRTQDSRRMHLGLLTAWHSSPARASQGCLSQVHVGRGYPCVGGDLGL